MVASEYNTLTFAKAAGEPVRLDLKLVAQDQWDHDPELWKHFGSFREYYRHYQSLVMATDRLEITVYKAQRIVAGLVLSQSPDFHYGVVIVPEVCRVVTGQNSPELARCLVTCFRWACEYYGVNHYQTMKHTGTNTHQITTRTVHY